MVSLLTQARLISSSHSVLTIILFIILLLQTYVFFHFLIAHFAHKRVFGTLEFFEKPDNLNQTLLPFTMQSNTVVLPLIFQTS